MNDMKRMNSVIRLEQYRETVKELKILNKITNSDEFCQRCPERHHFDISRQAVYNNEVQIIIMEMRIEQLEQELGESGE